jgi:hypothetical protein
MQEDQVQQRLQMLAQQVREIGQMTEALAADFPPAAQAVGQIKRLLLQIVQQAGSVAPMGTASDQAVPAGGSQAAGPY